MVLFEKNSATGFGGCGGYCPGSVTLYTEDVIELAAGDTVRMRMYGASGTYTQESGTMMRVELIQNKP